MKPAEYTGVGLMKPAEYTGVDLDQTKLVVEDTVDVENFAGMNFRVFNPTEDFV